MSGKIVGWAMEQNVRSPAAKLVLVKLADNANEEGLSWPSIELMVRHTELAQSSVYKQLKYLQTLGLIRVVERGDGRGKAYQLLIPSGLAAPPSRKRALSDGVNATSDGKRVPRRGNAYREEPSKEPSLNLAGDVPPACEAGVGRLAAELGNARVNDWFGEADFILGPPVTVSVDKKYRATHIANHFEGALRRAFGAAVEVRVRAVL